jgi:hypothetical protein
MDAFYGAAKPATVAVESAVCCRTHCRSCLLERCCNDRLNPLAIVVIRLVTALGRLRTTASDP